MKKIGRPLKSPDLIISEQLSKYKITENGCWEYSGFRNHNNYGRFAIKKRYYMAHRVSLAKYIKHEIPEGMMVCHHCDNPPCINPEHLYIGTAADNRRDMILRNRCGNVSRFTENDVINMLQMNNLGINRKTIGNKYQISETGLRQILKRERWAKIKYPL